MARIEDHDPREVFIDEMVKLRIKIDLYKAINEELHMLRIQNSDLQEEVDDLKRNHKNVSRK